MIYDFTINGWFLVLINLAYFCLGISEAIFVARYNEFDDQCQQIWSWILASSVLDIVIPVIDLCGIAYYLTKNNDKPNNVYENIYDISMYVARIGTIIIMIWANVTYYKINTSCYSFWTSQAHELWTFVVIHYFILWLCVGWIIGTLLMYMIMCCAVLIVPKEKKSVMRQRSKLFNTVASKLEPELV